MTDLNVVTERLGDAVDALTEFVKKLRSDQQDFGNRMHAHTWDTAQSVADERGRRIAGKSYDHRTAEQRVAHGATTDWTNPFGHFTAADRFFKQVDDVRDHANTDHEALVGTVEALQQALRQVITFYDNVEKNTAKGVNSLRAKDIDAIFTAVRKSARASADM
jgi:hypothetical protein